MATKKEKSAGAVVFLRKENKVYYLLLHYQPGHWDFPKGHVEGAETDEETATRETEEETGLTDIAIMQGFKKTIKYYFRAEGKTILKTVVFFLAETKTEEVKLSHEHVGYKWLGIEDALAQLSFKNAKEILKEADEFIKKFSR